MADRYNEATAHLQSDAKRIIHPFGGRIWISPLLRRLLKKSGRQDRLRVVQKWNDEFGNQWPASHDANVRCGGQNSETSARGLGQECRRSLLTVTATA